MKEIATIIEKIVKMANISLSFIPKGFKISSQKKDKISKIAPAIIQPIQL